MSPDLERRVRYNAWANRTVFDALFAGRDRAPAPAIAAFVHVLETEVTWTRRIARQPDPNIALWAAVPTDQVAAWLAECAAALAAIVSDPNVVESTFSYHNSRDQEFTNNVAEVLDHVLLHSAQYRGEAAGFANAAGARVPDLDYIFWLRAGEPAPPDVARR